MKSPEVQYKMVYFLCVHDIRNVELVSVVLEKPPKACLYFVYSLWALSIVRCPIHSNVFHR